MASKRWKKGLKSACSMWRDVQSSISLNLTWLVSALAITFLITCTAVYEAFYYQGRCFSVKAELEREQINAAVTGQYLQSEEATLLYALSNSGGWKSEVTAVLQKMPLVQVGSEGDDGRMTLELVGTGQSAVMLLTELQSAVSNCECSITKLEVDRHMLHIFCTIAPKIHVSK